MNKWTIYWNYSTKNMKIIFLMLTPRLFRLDWWSPTLQNFIQYILCCFIKTEELMLQSKIACHTFLHLYQPRPLLNWITETHEMPKKLGLFYVDFLTVPSYIQWDQFIIVQVTLPTQSHWVPSTVMLVFKSLHLNLFNVVIFLTFKVIFGDHPTILE